MIALKQFYSLLRQHRFFSAIYIVGTAASIAMTMMLFVVFYIKFSPLYPETNRDRMLVIKGTKRYPDGKPENWNCWGGISTQFLKEHVEGLEHVEAVACRMLDFSEPLSISIPTKGGKARAIGQGKGESKICAMYTDANFWKVFEYRFLHGRPYNKVECDRRAKVAVVSQAMAKRLYGRADVVGREVIVGSATLKIIGVVQDGCAAMSDSFADIWYPFFDESTLKMYGADEKFLGNTQAYILCDRSQNRQAVQEAIQEQARRLSLEDKEYDYDLIGQPDTFLKSTFRTSPAEEPDHTATLRYFLWILFALLVIPAINLSGMISSRMKGRREEIFVRRSYGARGWQIVTQVLTENLFLTGIGAALGTLLSFLIVSTASDWLLFIFEGTRPYTMMEGVQVNAPLRLLFNPVVLLSAVAVCLLLNVLSALLPALVSVSQAHPVQSLRSRGSFLWRRVSFIFVELVAVTAFVFLALDPLYVIVADRLMPRHYNAKGLFYAEFQPFAESRQEVSEGDEAEGDKAKARQSIYRFLSELKALPEIEDVCLAQHSAVPNGRSWSGTMLYRDTLETDSLVFTHAQYFPFVCHGDGDLPRLYQMTDALTGRPFVTPAGSAGKIVITENCANFLFGRKDVVGKRVGCGRELREVCGVVDNLKFYDVEQPYPTVFDVEPQLPDAGRDLPWYYTFVLRVKDGVELDGFEQRFKEKYAEQLRDDYFAFCEMHSLQRMAALHNDSSGQTNKLRLQAMLTFFAVLCIFLGMMGTFWIRCTDRRAEIGVRRSMGATQRAILRMFLGEASRLVTWAWIVTLPFLLYYANKQGLCIISQRQVMNGVQDLRLPQNIFWMHFAIVALLTFAVLQLTALIGTFIPASRACRTLPAEALKEE